MGKAAVATSHAVRMATAETLLTMQLIKLLYLTREMSHSPP